MPNFYDRYPNMPPKLRALADKVVLSYTDDGMDDDAAIAAAEKDFEQLLTRRRKIHLDRGLSPNEAAQNALRDMGGDENHSTTYLGNLASDMGGELKRRASLFDGQKMGRSIAENPSLGNVGSVLGQMISAPFAAMGPPQAINDIAAKGATAAEQGFMGLGRSYDENGNPLPQHPAARQQAGVAGQLLTPLTRGLPQTLNIDAGMPADSPSADPAADFAYQNPVAGKLMNLAVSLGFGGATMSDPAVGALGAAGKLSRGVPDLGPTRAIEAPRSDFDAPLEPGSFVDPVSPLDAPDGRTVREPMRGEGVRFKGMPKRKMKDGKPVQEAELLPYDESTPEYQPGTQSAEFGAAPDASSELISIFDAPDGRTNFNTVEATLGRESRPVKQITQKTARTPKNFYGEASLPQGQFSNLGAISQPARSMEDLLASMRAPEQSNIEYVSGKQPKEQFGEGLYSPDELPRGEAAPVSAMPVPKAGKKGKGRPKGAKNKVTTPEERAFMLEPHKYPDQMIERVNKISNKDHWLNSRKAWNESIAKMEPADQLRIEQAYADKFDSFLKPKSVGAAKAGFISDSKTAITDYDPMHEALSTQLDPDSFGGNTPLPVADTARLGAPIITPTKGPDATPVRNVSDETAAAESGNSTALSRDMELSGERLRKYGERPSVPRTPAMEAVHKSVNDDPGLKKFLLDESGSADYGKIAKLLSGAKDVRAKFLEVADQKKLAQMELDGARGLADLHADIFAKSIRNEPADVRVKLTNAKLKAERQVAKDHAADKLKALGAKPEEIKEILTEFDFMLPTFKDAKESFKEGAWGRAAAQAGERALSKAISFSKALMVLPNPGAHVANVAGDVMIGAVAGINPVWATKNILNGRLFAAVRKNSAEFQEMVGKGVLGSEAFDDMIHRTLAEVELEAKKLGGDATLFDVISLLHTKTTGRAGAAAGKFYNLPDQLLKAAVYLQAKEEGIRGAKGGMFAKVPLTADEAALHVQRFTPSYRLMNKRTSTFAGRIGTQLFIHPFIRFPAEAVRILTNSARYRPAHAAVSLGALSASMAGMWEMASAVMDGPSHEQIMKEYRGLPDYQKFPARLVVPLPKKNAKGHVTFVDVTYMVPLYDIFGFKPSRGVSPWEVFKEFSVHAIEAVTKRGLLLKDDRYETAEDRVKGKGLYGAARNNLGVVKKAERVVQGRERKHFESESQGRELGELFGFRTYEGGLPAMSRKEAERKGELSKIDKEISLVRDPSRTPNLKIKERLARVRELNARKLKLQKSYTEE